MRVLLVHNRYRSAQPSGEDAVVDEEARALAAHGCVVERLEARSDEIAQRPAHRRAALPAQVVWSRDGSRRLRDAVRAFRPDVVHVHNTFPLLSPSVLVAARRAGVAVVQTLHNFRPLCSAASFLRDGRVCEDCLGRSTLRGLTRGCYRGSVAATAPLTAMTQLHRVLRTWQRCVDVYVVPSAFAASKYVAAGWSPERLVVKPNTAPRPVTPREERPEGFACVARLDAAKGVDVLLSAWTTAFPAGEERLTVAGSGEGETALRTLADGMPGVELAGRLPSPEVESLLARSVALVVPSRSYEVFPRAIVEAYAMGVPVVASAIGSLPEVVEDGRTGLLVEPGSPEALAAALRRLAADPGLAAALGARARAAYDARYSPERTTAALVAVYERAVAARAATPSAAEAQTYV